MEEYQDKVFRRDLQGKLYVCDPKERFLDECRVNTRLTPKKVKDDLNLSGVKLSVFRLLSDGRWHTRSKSGFEGGSTFRDAISRINQKMKDRYNRKYIISEIRHKPDNFGGARVKYYKLDLDENN